MIVDNVASLVSQQLAQFGHEELSKKFPRDFELYMCALELVDDNETTVDYFTFPIMPSNISKTETEVTSLQSSLNGITIFNKSGFTPDELSIQGDFGRSLKLITDNEEFANNKYYDSALGDMNTSIGFGYYTSDSVNKGDSNKVTEFNPNLKTGFGCIKILQSIIHKAKSRGPTGITYRLYFYNLALGESYLVVPTKSPLVFTQNVQSSNMVWNYNLNLLIVADLSDIVIKGGSSPTPKSLQYSFTADKMLGGLPKLSAIRMLNHLNKYQ